MFTVESAGEELPVRPRKWCLPGGPPMLLVPVRVDRSSIHGMGIFALQPIKKNTRVWQFTPGFEPRSKHTRTASGPLPRNDVALRVH